MSASNMQGLLGHVRAKPIIAPLKAQTSKHISLVCRGTTQQTPVAAQVQQYTTEPLQVVQQTSLQGQGPACRLDRNSGALERDEYGKFVQFFRQASPYIEGHRCRTFVVVIPGVGP
jgi:hypothetical protein